MEKLKRYLIFIIGLYINSLGVALITKASLGTSPISSIPYVLSLNFTMSLGEFTIFFNVLLIILQVIILRKNFKLEYLLQFPVTIAFGYFIDLSMVMLGFVQPGLYIYKVLYLLLGCLILGFGVYLEVLANVVMLPGESFVRAVVFTWKTEFGTTKIIFDSSMAVIAAVMSLLFAHHLDGVREGTVIAALLVGFIARQFGRVLSFLPEKLFPQTSGTQEDTADAQEAAEKAGMPQNSGINCIVIGRQLGCGGSAIAERLAKELGYDFYDKKLIQLAAGTTGYEPEFISKHEENMTNSLLFDLVNQVYSYDANAASAKDAIYDAEAKAIAKAGKKGSCVIVGRCADAILQNQKNCLSIFLSAPKDYRIARVMEEQSLTREQADKLILKTDKRRADNYRYYTNRIWGHAANYGLCLNAELGEEYVVKTILDTMRAVK